MRVSEGESKGRREGEKMGVLVIYINETIFPGGNLR